MVNPLYSRNTKTGTFANSEDPDEMPHNAAFHQGYTLFVKEKIDVQTKNKTILFRNVYNYNLPPLDICNRQSQVYCNKPEGRTY